MTKHALLASSAVVSVVAALSAASVAAAADQWNGFYIGLHAGGAMGDIDWTNVSNTNAYINLAPGLEVPHSPDGVLGGAQLGFNYQMAQWVFGLELSGSGMDFDETKISPFTGTELTSVEMEWSVTAAVRLGMAFDDSLVYVKGGYAGAQVKTFHSDFSTPVATYATDETHNGFVVGAGLEHMIGDNVSVALEYNYLDLGNTDHTGAASTGGTVVNDVDVRLHTVTARLNWYLYHP